MGTDQTTTQSTEVSFTKTSVNVTDVSTPSYLDLKFTMVPNIDTTSGSGWNTANTNPGRFPFQATAAEIFWLLDDLHGLRDGHTGVKRYFEISIGAYRGVPTATFPHDYIFIQSADKVSICPLPPYHIDY